MLNKNKFFKSFVTAFVAVVIVFLTPMGSSTTSATEPMDSRVQVSIIENVWFPSHQQRQSRNSAVKVEGMSGGHGSGTYVKIDGEYIVITARHVVDRDSIYYVSHEGERVVGEVIWKSQQYDIAALRIPKLRDRKPVSLQVTGGLDVGDAVMYTGYPSSYELLTARAYVSGHNTSYRATLLQGFVWFGYSGSGVFDDTGRLRAVVVAIGTERFGMSRVPLETMVYIHELTRDEVDQIKQALAGN